MPIDAVQPDVQPATEAATFPYMAVVGIAIRYDLKTTSATITYRKFGPTGFSPFGPFTLEIPDFDAWAMERAQAGDMRPAEIGQGLTALTCELANEAEAKRIGGGDGK